MFPITFCLGNPRKDQKKPNAKKQVGRGNSTYPLAVLVYLALIREPTPGS